MAGEVEFALFSIANLPIPQPRVILRFVFFNKIQGNTYMLTVEKHSKKVYLLFMVIFALLYLGTIGTRPLFTPDEIRYAEIPREILQDNDWVVPHFGGLRYFEKPIMGYWLTAISLLCFGENEFAVRFSSALAAGLSALLLFLVIRKLKGFEAATITTLIFMSCGLVFGIGTFAVLDGPFSFFVTASLLTFYLATQTGNMKKKMGWLALFGACCGAAFMTKGFLAFVLPIMVFVPFMFWQKRWKELFFMAPLPLVTAALVALPWCLMIARREPDFWHYFAVVEHFDRMFKNKSSQHPQPLWFFIPIIIAGTMPWTLTVPGICSRFKKAIPQDPLVRYCLCWLVIPFIFFSISSGKLGTYILPCYPALAYLLYVGLKNYFSEGSTRIFEVTCKITKISLLAAAGIFAVIQLLSDLGISQKLMAAISTKLAGLPTAPYEPGETWKWIAIVLAAAGWAVCLHYAARIKEFERRIIFFAIGAMLPMLAFHFVIPQLVIYNKAPGPFLARIADKISPEDTIVAYNNMFPAISWYFKRDNVYMLHKGGEMQYGLNYPDTQHRLISKERFLEMIKEPRKGKLIYLIKTRTFRDMALPAQYELFEPNKDRIMFSVFDPIPAQ